MILILTPSFYSNTYPIILFQYFVYPHFLPILSLIQYIHTQFCPIHSYSVYAYTFILSFVQYIHTQFRPILSYSVLSRIYAADHESHACPGWLPAAAARRTEEREIYSVKVNTIHFLCQAHSITHLFGVHDVTLAWTIQAVLHFTFGGAIKR